MHLQTVPHAVEDGHTAAAPAGTSESRTLLNLTVQLIDSQAGKGIPVGLLALERAVAALRESDRGTDEL